MAGETTIVGEAEAKIGARTTIAQGRIAFLIETSSVNVQGCVVLFPRGYRISSVYAR